MQLIVHKKHDLYILPRKNGFTLIEVLVALAIVAVALTTLITAIANQIHMTSLLRDKTMAHWVALNKIAETTISDKWPNAGDKKGTYLMAEYEWFWMTTVKKTDDKNVRRMDIEVRKDKNSEMPNAALIAYIGKP